MSEFLKFVITEPTVDVNEKHEKKYEIQNVINLYLTSNYGDAFFLDDDDRRYFIWDIPDTKLTDALGKAWVDELVKYAQSPKGRAALHYHLLHFPIDARIFQPQGSPPETEAKCRAKEYSQNEVQRWIEEFVESPESKTGRAGENVWLAREELYRKFRGELNTDHYPFNTFQKFLREKLVCIGRTKVEMAVINKNKLEWRKIQPGFWVLRDYKPNGRFPTLADVVSAWKAQQRKIADPFLDAVKRQVKP